MLAANNANNKQQKEKTKISNKNKNNKLQQQTTTASNANIKQQHTLK